MVRGDIVYLPYKGSYIRYKVRKVFDDELLVVTYKTGQTNYVTVDDVLTTEEFSKIYNNERIFE